MDSGERSRSQLLPTLSNRHRAESIHPRTANADWHVTGSRACFESGLWNLPSTACLQAPSQQYTLCFLRGWGDCGWKKNTFDNNKEGERVKDCAVSQGDKPKNSGRSPPLARSGPSGNVKQSFNRWGQKDRALFKGREEIRRKKMPWEKYVSGG